MMNKVVLVTGGAQGIGKAIALELAASHYDIVINYLTSCQEAEMLKNELVKEYGIRCLAIQADVSKEEEVNEMISKIEEELGGVDILVNNAAVDLSNLFHLKNAEEFRRTMDVNVIGAFNCCKRVYKHMLEKEYGRIINISSTRAYMSQADTESYTAAKGGISALTHGLSISLAGKVRVNSISPGWIDTGAYQYSENYEPQYSLGDTSQHPAGRIGNPLDIASMVLFLCSDKAGFITGENITIDGGMTKQMIYHDDFGWKYK